ncbi:MAG: glycosyltransferase family 4 protein, partial [Cyclobacteriaceae bacterium]
KNAGNAHRSVWLTRKITPLTDLVALFQLIGIIIRFRPRIIHSHTPKAGLLGMLAAWICRVPIRIHTVAGLPLMETKGIKLGLLKVTEQITYACAHKIYPNSKGLMEFIASHFKDYEKKLRIIGMGSSNGIDTTHFLRTPELENVAKELRKKLGIADNGIVFGFVGRMVGDKGIRELVAAFKKINESGKKVYLLLVGKMEADLDPIEKADREYINSTGNVFVVGYQHDVRPWMLAMDVFVFPSYREGFPNVVMQAACLELPNIVSDINGCNEIIQHGETGIVVPAKNQEALAEAMEYLLDNVQCREQFGKRAREFVKKHFEQRLVWDNLLKEYLDLLGHEKLNDKK